MSFSICWLFAAMLLSASKIQVLCFGTQLAIVAAQSKASSASIEVTGAASASSVLTASPTPIINIDNQVGSVLNATAWSLIYTYPVYIFANFAGSVLEKVSINEIYHQRYLASPTDPGVIKPNIDTLYSRVVLDLSQGNVVLTVPNISDGRYWNYPVYDLFGNDVAEVGVVNGNKPGDYLIRRTDDVLPKPGYHNTNASNTNTAQYKGIVNLPTTYGTMLIRLFVFSNTTTELDTLHRYQNQSRLTPIPRASQQTEISHAPNLTSIAPNGTFAGVDTPAKLFELSARLLPFNEPEIYSERYRAATILARAGLYDGRYHPQPGVNLTYAAMVANASIAADTRNSTNIRKFSNGWQLSTPSHQGNFGPNYAIRAYIAIAGYQQQTVRQTLYPGYQNLGFTSIVSLKSNTSLLSTFSAKPRLKATGFWSLSVYGADQYLVQNELNRFEIGDRSFNLTYQDGSGHVYGPNSDASHDGPFQVLFQPANTKPPSNWTGNWLPCSESFSFILRWYVPTDAMTNGSYIYPKVETVGTIQ